MCADHLRSQCSCVFVGIWVESGLGFRGVSVKHKQSETLLLLGCFGVAVPTACPCAR